MAQHIDLYRPELDIRREVPIWGRLALAVGASFLAGFAFWLAAAHDREQSRQALTAAETQHSRTASQLQQLQGLWDAPEVARAERRVEQAEARAATLEAARELLDTRLSRARQVSMTEPLLALARTHHESVWITAMRVDGRTPVLELTGRSLTPDALPNYIGSLQRDGFGMAGEAPALEAQTDNGHIVFQYRFGSAEEQP